MSADNYIGVYPRQGGYAVVHGVASLEEEDCMYRGSEICLAQTRELALVAAHDQAKKEVVLEYGVCEMPAIPTEYCGRCRACVKDRNIVSDDLPKCDACHEVIFAGEWLTMTSEGTFHNRCEPIDKEGN
jgi:hypothetical protein